MTEIMTEIAVREMADRIVATVRELGGHGVTFVELRQRIPEIRGDKVMTKGDAGVIVAFDINDLFTDAMRMLFAEKRLDMSPTSPLTYLVDGFATHIPIARKVPKGGQCKTDHWLPVTWSIPGAKP